MKEFNDDNPERHGSTDRQLVLRVTEQDFQRACLEKLSRLETKMEMQGGTHQPRRMEPAEDRITVSERSGIRCCVYDRIARGPR
jgi:hypothetical protein